MKKTTKSRSTKVARGKQKKNIFSLKEKVIMAVCAVITATSLTTIGVFAAATWSSPSPSFSGSTTAFMPVERTIQPCCGTANKKVYGCTDDPVRAGTDCSANGKRINPPILSFPAPGKTVNWTCACQTPGGEPITDRDGKPVVSQCSASRKGPGAQCGINSFKTFSDVLPLPPYNNLSYVLGSEPCVKGYAVKIETVKATDKSGGFCSILKYYCADDCTGAISANTCVYQFCGDEKDHQSRCGDGFLDPNETCETLTWPGQPHTGLFGKTCDNSSTKGSCGALKCTAGCQIDDSGCYPCPSNTNK